MGYRYKDNNEPKEKDTLTRSKKVEIYEISGTYTHVYAVRLTK